jgi:RNA polymerase sigma factor (sigma-70 family)
LTDQQLLRSYVSERSETAFAELVRRYLDLAYSAAVRVVRDGHLAEDVTQKVFIALTRQAPELLQRLTLAGWLHRTAENIAANTARTEARRHCREQKAIAMSDLLAGESGPSWEKVAP